MKRQIVFTIVVVALLVATSATQYTKCGLAKALLQNGFPKKELPNWVCLVFSESSGNTAAKGGPNTDGSYDYGLFQINNRYWCQDGYPGKGCGINCYNLLNNNIADDSKCAQLIFADSGFDAWNGWLAHCQGKLPDLSKCGI